MSSCPRTHGRESLMYKPNQPHFFKIILDDHQRKLSIPRKFAKNYGKHLSDWVILKVPSGQSWKVDIVKIDGQVWLEKGWQKFMEYYSIVTRSLLVLRYVESNSSFNVTIFDSTCTEIEYPYTLIHEASPELRVPKVESDHDIPVEISCQSSPSQKRKEKSSPLSSSRPHKKMKKAGNFTNTTGKGTNVEQKKENRSLTSKEKSKVTGRASSSFQSPNPTFEIKMTPSNVDKSSRPNIPASFVTKYMTSKNGEALLVLDGRTWSIKYSSRIKRTRFVHSGWSEFERDNRLQVGDVCKFELVDPCKMLFRVVISRSSSIKKSMDKKTRIILRKISSSNSTKLNPFFKVVIKPSHLEGNRVNIPVGFFQKLKQITQTAKLVVYGKMWFVKLLLYPNHGRGPIGKISAGWASFARENCLKEGDVCTFKLIDAQELLLKVSISRHSSTN